MEEEVDDWIATKGKRRKAKAIPAKAQKKARSTKAGRQARTIQPTVQQQRGILPFKVTAENVKNGVVFFLLLAVMLLIMSVLFGALYYSNIITSEVAASSVATEFAFLLAVIGYLWAYKRMSGAEIVSAVGIGLSRISLRNIAIGVGIFAVILLFSISIGLLSYATNTTISTNSQLVLASEPLWFYIFSFTLVPLCEELLFRAFMVPRLGIVISAIIFGLSHASYGSTFGVDIIAATLFALLAGYAFRKTKSIYPSMIAHALVNALAAAAYI